MTTAGYYTLPTIHDETIVFVSEDDLWTVSAAGGVARRLTSNLGMTGRAALSPDGQWLAFTGREEGTSDVYLMPAAGGPATRLTFLGGATRVVGWMPDGQHVVFASNATRPFARDIVLFQISTAGGEAQQLPIGPAVTISFGPYGGQVIGRNTVDVARWKRYRGGTAGDIWIDAEGSGTWRRLIQLQGNVALPLWMGERIYFIADHEGIGNIYSCLPSGADLRRHTRHTGYYVRNISSDGRRIVYHAGADLYLFDPAAGESRRLDVACHSPRVQRNRKFVEAADYLQGSDLHPKGQAVAITTRGQLASMSNWEGAVSTHGETRVDVDGVAVAVRRRLAVWLHDGARLVAIADSAGEEALEVHHADGREPARRLSSLDIGRPVAIAASPTRDQVVLTNHRHELILVDLAKGRAAVLDRSPYGRMRGLAWAPDGRWIAYGYPCSIQTSVIRLCQVESGQITEVTRPVLVDEEPAFDPEGKYLYFLSSREFNPVYDSLHFDLNFPAGRRPYLVTLRKDLLSPFVPVPRPHDEKDKEGEGGDGAQPGQEAPATEEASPEGIEPAEPDSTKEHALEIDLDGIADRVLAFPVDEGLYGQIRGLKGKALFTCFPVEGSLGGRPEPGGPPPAKGRLEVYDFAEQSHETLVDGLSSFELSLDGKTLIYRAGNRLRVLKAGEKPDDKAGSAPGRKSGWLDLGRPKVQIDPGAEWAQMFRHAWRLQRDQFWTEDMSGVDWQEVFRRYWPLVSRVATRSEFSDLMWEMQGELGTSHAYEFGGDYRPEPDYAQGYLGADFRYDESSGGYQVVHIVRGDTWNDDASSPLAAPGVNVQEGDLLLAVHGHRLHRHMTPQQALVNHAGDEVLVSISSQDGGEPRTVTVRTLRFEGAARYREWVEENRRRVHAATDGRIGYVHIPDMGPSGYAEFHRGYLAEVTRQGLIVDVRYNSGGHVSQLLLEKLARRHIGYDVPRWGEPIPYPMESVTGPMVALSNELTGSDGDIFCHAFKLLGLGPLLGKRTWGGVIGIWPREPLIDGGITTQPEFSTWFEDVGWGIENYGTDPDIEVEITPEDWIAGRDPQLDRAVAEALRLMAEAPPHTPDFSTRPQLPLPTLPD
jgi:tricorn protease